MRTEGPSLRMSFFAKSQGMAQWHASRMPVGRRGVFMGQVEPFRGEWQLTHPQMVLFGTDDEDAAARSELSLDAIGDLYPIYPLTKGVESWDLQRAIAFARTVVDELPELLPESVRRDHDLLDARHRARRGSTRPTPGPRSRGPSTATGSRRRWSPSWCWLGAAGSSARSAPWRAPGETAACSRPSTSGCRSS